MSSLLGFMVLLGPLVAVVVWLFVCLGIVWLLSKYFKFFKRGGVQLVVVFAMLLSLFADEIAGRIYFNHLCSTESGVKVYQTVELPAEYWDTGGKARFYVNQYDHEKMRYIFPDKRMVDAPQFRYSWVTKPYSQFFHIDKEVIQITDREKGTALGEYFLFRYWGGWLVRNFSPHNTGPSCEVKDLDSWPLNIFKSATSTR